MGVVNGLLLIIGNLKFTQNNIVLAFTLHNNAETNIYLVTYT